MINPNPVHNLTISEMLSAIQVLPRWDRETFKGYFNSQFDINNFLAEYWIKSEGDFSTIIFWMPLFISTYIPADHFDIVNNNWERRRYKISNS